MNFALPGFMFYLVLILVVGFITYNINKAEKIKNARRFAIAWVIPAFMAVWITSLITISNSSLRME